VRRIRQLLRKRSLRAAEQSLVVEGPELLSVALAAGIPIEAVYVAPEGRTTPGVTAVVERVFATGVRVFDLAPGVMERIADTVTPQPVLAVVGFAPATLDDIRGSSMVVVCVDVRDPGNVGTIIRTADAAGVGGVVCCDGTVDPTNPKTVRSSAGSLFHVPVVAGGEPAAVIDHLRGAGLRTVGTVVRGGTDYTAFDWRRPVALVLGNEAAGLDDRLLAGLDDRVSIPMVGRSESLNVSVSAAVLCFEALRHRSGPGGPADPPPAEVGGDRSGPRPTMPVMDRSAVPGTTAQGAPDRG
jgi:TrmH family RNA methyltransferase